MSERYILNKADKYAYITPTNVVEKTEQKEQVTVFTSQEATAMLKRAHKKLNGFTMIPLVDSLLGPAKEPEGKNDISRKGFSAEIRNDVYERTQGKCALCGKFVRFDQFTIDHIIPLAKGGTNDRNNLQCTCKRCNAMKQDFSQDEFIDRMIDILAYQMKKNGKKKYRKRLKKCCK